MGLYIFINEFISTYNILYLVKGHNCTLSIYLSIYIYIYIYIPLHTTIYSMSGAVCRYEHIYNPMILFIH